MSHLPRLAALCIPFLLLLAACSGDGPADGSVRDVHSFARPDEAVMTHLDLDIKVDFREKVIAGKAALTIDNKTGVDRIYLDTRDLDIERVTVGDPEREATFTLGDPEPHLGSELAIDIAPDTRQVTVYYRTRPHAAALQWLSPEQTTGGQYPFLFTQSQAILARTWIPCQDSPGIRFTYRARVEVPRELMAVMSASNAVARNDSGVYVCQMPQPIPSYLLALAVGDLTFRPLGPRSGVYAEPPVVARAAYEFADTERMMDAAEALYGPYRWERYDIIVLPPSFPFGGMENPRLTFATPTILAGDRSLVALVAHELAHSWSGNLVTNATWNEFWLNEGFTTYFENRIMEAVYGVDYARMLETLDYRALLKEMDEEIADEDDTHLHLDLEGRDPDEGMTGVAYDKGRLFLRMLEVNVGRERFDAFLKTYFERHAFRTMTSREFVDYLVANLLDGSEARAEELRVDEWIYGPGLPENCPIPSSPEFERVTTQISAWQAGTPAERLDTNGWTTHHWLYFLRNLPESLTAEQMAALDNAFGFTRSGNSEITCQWLELAIVHDYDTADARLEEFLTTVGRRKFLMPLYRALAATDTGMARAREIYEKARPIYHPVSYASVDALIGKPGKAE